MANPTFPEEILVEIFSRLVKCKCLSKHWLSFLSTPHFITLYLSLDLCPTHHQQELIMVTQSHSLHLLTPTVNNDFVSRKLDLPGSWTQMIGSCNGLVLLANTESQLYLVNPVTSRMVKIPDFDLALERTKSTEISKSKITVITHGFGYDASTDEYKIVTLSYYSSVRGLFVDVYYVKKGVWKRLDNFPFELFMPAPDPVVSGVFANGAIHWYVCCKGSRYPSFIATFGLANEEFYNTGSPRFLHALYTSLVVRGGRLCVVSSYYRRGGGDVWTMEERGSVESWKKFTILEYIDYIIWNWREVKLLCFVGEEDAVLTTKKEYESDESWKRFCIPENIECPEVKPVCFVGEEGVVLRSEDGRLFVYDMREGTMKAFVVDGVPACCMDMGIGNFVDSLA